jgi:hypothetical protein
MVFKGELHNVKLINFSVDIDEVKDLIPKGLEVFQENGKAIISMVDVHLKKMRPAWIPLIQFSYRHVAFRLLLDDKSLSGEMEPKGVFFLKSFSENIPLNWAGNLIGNYNLSFAKIKEYLDAVSLKSKSKFINYALDPYEKIENNASLFDKIKRIDRAYAKEKVNVYVTQIVRKEWPIEPIKCYHFATDFFKTATFLGAFQVKKPILYTWEEPKLV